MRELHTARLIRKELLSASAQCYHLEFAFEGTAPAFEPGQFLSMVAEDSTAKTYTRAYSIASAPRGQEFDLCVNRVEGGFFSNYLCDLAEGATVRWHGPHGMFTLKRPVTDTLLLAAGTGIAPLRAMLQGLFAESGPDPSDGRTVWLVYEGDGQDELLYDKDFLALASRQKNFRYVPVSTHDREQAIRQAASAIDETASLRIDEGFAEGGEESKPRAYVCGLAEFVKPVRTQLLGLGWLKSRVLFERYD